MWGEGNVHAPGDLKCWRVVPRARTGLFKRVLKKELVSSCWRAETQMWLHNPHDGAAVSHTPYLSVQSQFCLSWI